MTSTTTPHHLVVIELTGGNDYLNTVVPYADPLYYDHRPSIAVPGDQVLPIDDHVGLPPSMAPIMDLYRAGQVAVIMGVGYPNHNRSHFKSMDIWHTASPANPSTNGWLGGALRELDPASANPAAAVAFGGGLPLALSASGTLAAAVDDLGSYTLLDSLPDDSRRTLLSATSKLYAQTRTLSPVHENVYRSGHALHTGSDLLRAAWSAYTPMAQYPRHTKYLNPICGALKSIVAVLSASLGTQICYARHGSFDTHGDERARHALLWQVLSHALAAFLADLELHDCRDRTTILLFSEFGRRISDNRGGTDHGAGGMCLLIGSQVRGGLYGDYPKLDPASWDEGDVRSTTDFRAVYTSILEQFLSVDATAGVPSARTFDRLPLHR